MKKTEEVGYGDSEGDGEGYSEGEGECDCDDEGFDEGCGEGCGEDDGYGHIISEIRLSLNTVAMIILIEAQ